MKVLTRGFQGPLRGPECNFSSSIQQGFSVRAVEISARGSRDPLRSAIPLRSSLLIRRTQEGCGGLGGENPAAFPKARPIFQQPFFLPESSPNLGRDSISCCRKVGKEFTSSAEICRETFPARNFGQPQPSRVF